MDKTDYPRLLCDASIHDSTKSTECSIERPKTRGRPPKHYHPLLEKENELYTKVHNILSKSIADSLCPKGSKLAHLYGSPKTHKPELSMRPIYRQLIHTITHSQNGWRRNESLCQPMLTWSVISSNSPKISETSLLMLTTYSYLTTWQPCLPMLLPTKPSEYLPKSICRKLVLVPFQSKND